MSEGLFYHIMVDVNKRLEGWNKELYDKLSFDFLIKCAKNGKINEWNLAYEAYLRSEWERIFPVEKYQKENNWRLFDYGSGFVRPNYIKKNFKNAIIEGARFSGGDIHTDNYEHVSQKETCISRETQENSDYLDEDSLKAESWKAHQEEKYFSGMHLEGADFREAHLEMADFRGVHLEGARLGMAYLTEANFREAYLERARFGKAHLERAYFKQAHLERANFWGAKLEKACFKKAHLMKAYFKKSSLFGVCFERAHLEKADFRWAHLEGAKFIFAIVDGETLFTKNTIDTKTDFTGTPISATRIDPELRTKLERNIRHIHWEKWYKKPKFYPFFGYCINSLWGLCCRIQHLFKDTSKDKPKGRYDSKDYPSLENSTLYRRVRKVLSWSNNHSATMITISEQDVEEIDDEEQESETKLCWVDRIINAFVRFFWWISDYGSSTKRIIAVFFGWNILWAFIYYYALPSIPEPFLAGTNTTVLNVSHIGTAVLQTNLMMFSITDLATDGLHFLPMLFVTTHIVVGYFILAALITRLGIMFQNLSP